MKKVLILCNDFPPLNSIGAERPYGWFKYFRDNNIEPVIITKEWGDASPSPEKLIYGKYSRTKFKTELHPEGKIIRVAHKLTMPDKLMINHGNALLRKAFTFLYKMLSFPFSFFDKHENIYLAAKDYLSAEKVDALLITAEPFILFKYGYLLKKQFELKWIADYRDGWFLNHETIKSSFFLNKFLIKWEYLFERKYMKRVDLITCVDEVNARSIASLHQKKFGFAYNGFWSFYQPNEEPNNEKCLYITHTGTLTTGQRIQFLLDAIVELDKEGKIKPGDLKLRMIGLEYFAKQLARVKNHAPELEHYIYTTPRVSKQEAMRFNYISDYCLALTDADISGIYAKVYDYIASSTPILVVPTDHQMLEEIVKKLGAGKLVENKEELKVFLLEQIGLKKAGISPPKISLDKNKAWFYSRETQAKKMAQEILNLVQ